MSLVKAHAKDFFFLVDTNFTYAQVVVLRVRWLKALPYEINIDENFVAITKLLSKEVDKNAQGFGTIEEEKESITKNLQITNVSRKKAKIVKRLIEQFDDEDEEDGEGKEKGQGPLLITEGQDEDE